MKKTLLFGSIVILLTAMMLFQKTYVGSAASAPTVTTTPSAPVVALMSVPSGIPNPGCTDNYTSWTRSTTYKTSANWFVGLFQPSDPRFAITNFQDINGDGLPDFMYHQKYDPTNYGGNDCYQSAGKPYYEENSCVLLNNTHGWDTVYKCVVRCELAIPGNTTSAIPVFYGDCAG